MGGHRGGGGFPVGAGDAQGIFIAPHDGAPSLRPLIDGDAAGNSAGDLGVGVADGGGADDHIASADVVGAVTDGDGDAHGAEMLYRSALHHIRALHLHAHALQDLGEGAHGHAADAGEVDASAGLHIVHDILRRMFHGCSSKKSGIMTRRRLFFLRKYSILHSQKKCNRHCRANFHSIGRKEAQP